MLCLMIILRVLDVSFNNIGDDWMAVTLQHNKSLTRLGVARCGLSVKGAVVCVFNFTDR